MTRRRRIRRTRVRRGIGTTCKLARRGWRRGIRARHRGLRTLLRILRILPVLRILALSPRVHHQPRPGRDHAAAGSGEAAVVLAQQGAELADTEPRLAGDTGVVEVAEEIDGRGIGLGMLEDGARADVPATTSEQPEPHGLVAPMDGALAGERAQLAEAGLAGDAQEKPPPRDAPPRASDAGWRRDRAPTGACRWRRGCGRGRGRRARPARSSWRRVRTPARPPPWRGNCPRRPPPRPGRARRA
jgi:hypothetical protein